MKLVRLEVAFAIAIAGPTAAAVVDWAVCAGVRPAFARTGRSDAAATRAAYSADVLKLVPTLPYWPELGSAAASNNSDKRFVDATGSLVVHTEGQFLFYLIHFARFFVCLLVG